MARSLTRVGCLLLTTVAAGAASAHEGHDSHTPGGAVGTGADPLPMALFASGLLVLGAGVYLHRREDVEGSYALTGLVLGLAGLAGAVALAI